MELFEGQVCRCAGEDVEVRMDPRHLHQIVWNLCENAVKYASEAAGGIAVELSWGRLPGNRRPYLEVADRGPGIYRRRCATASSSRSPRAQPAARASASSSRASCASCNRAALVHEPRRGGGSIFRIVFADPARWSAE